MLIMVSMLPTNLRLKVTRALLVKLVICSRTLARTPELEIESQLLINYMKLEAM